MATRSFTALSLVQLPRLNANGSCALGAEILAAAEPHELAPAVVETRDAVRAALLVLRRALRESTLDASLADTPDVREANTMLGSCWNGLHAFLTGWSCVLKSAEADKASALLQRLFPAGLSFLRLAYRQLWTQSGIRLDGIEQEELAIVIRDLGGGKLLTALRRAHRGFGEALGLTVAPDSATEVTSVREALNEFNASLRDYVVQVTALQRRKDPASLELPRRLLAPILAAESSATNKPAPAAPSSTPPEADPASAIDKPTLEGVADASGSEALNAAGQSAPHVAFTNGSEAPASSAAAEALQRARGHDPPTPTR